MVGVIVTPSGGGGGGDSIAMVALMQQWSL